MRLIARKIDEGRASIPQGAEQQLPGWERRDWKNRVYYRQEPITNRLFLVFYNEDDPGDRLKEQRVEIVPGFIPRDGLAEAGYVEKLMELHFALCN